MLEYLYETNTIVFERLRRNSLKKIVTSLVEFLHNSNTQLPMIDMVRFAVIMVPSIVEPDILFKEMQESPESFADIEKDRVSDLVDVIITRIRE